MINLVDEMTQRLYVMKDLIILGQSNSTASRAFAFMQPTWFDIWHQSGLPNNP